MRASDGLRPAAGPGLRGAPGLGEAARAAARSRGGAAGLAVRRAESSRAAPRWSGLRRVRAGGDEAGGCGPRAAGARGRGHGARRAPPSAGLAGIPAQLCSPWPASSPVRPAAALGAGALCLCALPPATLPPALCFAALGSRWEPRCDPHPVCTSTHSTVPPPVPLCCIALLSSRVTCHSPGTRLLPFSFFLPLSFSCVSPLTFFSLWSLVTPPEALSPLGSVSFS